jgi:DNA-binding NtrC family response regulator
MNLFKKLKEMNILLIDDDEWIRDSMSLFFESEGCRLLALETAEEGLKELNRKAYEIIFIDYKLPGMDGLSFVKKIEGRHPDTRIILITAYGDEVFKRAGRLQIHDVIAKPFTSDDIQQSLTRLLDNRCQDN